MSIESTIERRRITPSETQQPSPFRKERIAKILTGVSLVHRVFFGFDYLQELQNTSPLMAATALGGIKTEIVLTPSRKIEDLRQSLPTDVNQEVIEQYLENKKQEIEKNQGKS